MRRSLLVLFFVAATVRGATSIPPIEYRHRTLPNGLEVYAIQDHSTPTVAIQVWYRVGSKDDPDHRSGFAHLFEHMMFKSTKNMPSEMMDRITEDVGGANNATTLDDATVYYEVVPSNYLETLLWAEGERMGSLDVNEANFKSERDVVKEEYRYRVLAPPYGMLFNALPADTFVKHPYKRPGIGNIEELDAATLEDVRSFHATYYRPDDAVLIVAGDFEQQQLDAWVDQYLGAVPKPSTTMPDVNVPEPPRTEEKRVAEHGANVPLPAIAFTWLTAAASNEDAVPLTVINTLLTEGDSSRLQQKLVRGEIAAEVFSQADLREDLGMFAVAAIMASGHQTAEAEKIIREQIASLASQPVPAAELQKAKNLMLTSELRERETSEGKAFDLGEAIAIDHDANAVNTSLTRLQSLTAEDVQRVAKKYLVDGKPVVITYTDQGEKK
jgi:zinc protease